MSESISPNSSPYKVMLVDDSLVVRGMFTRILNQDPMVEIIASVSDGQAGVNNLDRYKGQIDVIVLDIEMPVLTGLEALPKLLAIDPTVQIIMASTLTKRNAEISLQAMSSGATDYIPKPTTTEELVSAEEFKRELLEKVKNLGLVRRKAQEAIKTSTNMKSFRASGIPAVESNKSGGLLSKKKEAQAFSLRPIIHVHSPKAIAISSSTGGPQALLQLLKDFPTDLKQPIFITQHMPPTFTTILANHITTASGRSCKEAQDGEIVESGKIYLAPGDYHMEAHQKGDGVRLKLTQEPPENYCRPAADVMLRSLAQVYGGKLLSVVLTGMGSDGKKGCEIIAERGGIVIAQDEETSVVWGMPGAVATAGLCNAVLPLNEICKQVEKYASRIAA